MKIEVGTKVVGTEQALSHRVGKTGVVDGYNESPDGYWVLWDEEDEERFAGSAEVRPVEAITLEVGKTYELNNGEVHKCTKMLGDDPLALYEGEYGPLVIDGALYHQDGRFGAGFCPILNVKREVTSSRDPELTSPYGDNNHPLPDVTPETGTLAELKVKPEDVVECVENSGCPWWTVGEQYEVTKDGSPEDDSGFTYGDFYDPQPAITFRIISRASDTPKPWGEMTDAEKGALLLAEHEGKEIEVRAPEIDHTGEIFDYRWREKNEGFLPDLAYHIKPEPKRETVTLYHGPGDTLAFTGYKRAKDDVVITYTRTNGKPDLDSIKMEEA